jgi:hypothetical protein
MNQANLPDGMPPKRVDNFAANTAQGGAPFERRPDRFGFKD